MRFAVTPSDIFSWQQPTEPLTRSSGRIAMNKMDDVQAALLSTSWRQMATFTVRFKTPPATSRGSSVAEIPPKPQKWCELRKIVFSWTHAKFPFSVRSGRKLNFTEPGIVTVTGKAFFDIGPRSPDQSNRRPNFPGYAVWEIHPVMKLTVQ
jgi:hypothetical protein